MGFPYYHSLLCPSLFYHAFRIRWRAPSGEEGAAVPRSSGDPAGTGAGGQHMGCMCDDMAKTPGCSTACSARAGAPKISTALRRYTPMVRVTRGRTFSTTTSHHIICSDYVHCQINVTATAHWCKNLGFRLQDLASVCACTFERTC